MGIKKYADKYAVSTGKTQVIPLHSSSMTWIRYLFDTTLAHRSKTSLLSIHGNPQVCLHSHKCNHEHNTTLSAKGKGWWCILWACNRCRASWRILCRANDQSHAEYHWFILICGHTPTCTNIKTPQEAYRGHTEFPGFQRSPRENIDMSDPPKKRINSSPFAGVGPSLKIAWENIVVWHVGLIINSISSG